jgi:hypothetical protein
VLRRLGLGLALVVASMVAGARAAHAFSTGFVGNCASCHTGGVSTPVTLTADVPCLTAGMTTAINVSGNVPSPGSAGLDLAIASGPGSLTIGGANSAGTKISGADVTHSMSKLGMGGVVRFSALFVAPSVPATTTVQLHVFFLAADNNGGPTGDSTNQATLSITVAPAPTCGPGACGTITNVCGAAVACGSCAPPQTCGGGGIANQCGSCTPPPNLCAGKSCGAVADGCGGFVSCGACLAGQTCNASNLCVAAAATVPALGRIPLLVLASALLLVAAIGLARKRRAG